MLLPVLRLSLLSSLIAAAVAAAAPSDLRGEPVALTRLQVDGRGAVTVDFRASSGGCTSAADFSVNVVADAAGQHLRFTRLRDDGCEAFVPQGAALTLPVVGLRTDLPIFVVNPLFVAR